MIFNAIELSILWMRPRAGLNQVARKGVRPWPREGRRRLKEPPQPRWGHGLQPRTTGESPITRPKNQKNKKVPAPQEPQKVSSRASLIG